MDAGQLKHRLAIDSPVKTRDAGGAPVTTFQRLGRAWASIEPLRASKVVEGGQVLTANDVRIRMYWTPRTGQITTLWRLVEQLPSGDGEVYDVVSVAHIRLEHFEVEILAKRGVNRG